MLNENSLNDIVNELENIKVLYKNKKQQMLIQLDKFGKAKAPEVDTVQHDMDSLRRELCTIRTYKKSLKKLLKITYNISKHGS